MDHTIDLRQFRYFLAVSDTLHFGRAAQQLHISQPPLSRQIRQLEDQLGVALFIRSPAGLILTDAGQALVPEARKTLVCAERAVAAARAARHGGASQLIVGYSTVFDRSVIPDVSAPLAHRFPNCRIIYKGKHSISLVRDIRNGAMDVAFIGLHTEAQGLKVETIFEEPIVVALPASHRLAKKRRIAFDDLRNEPLFWFERRLNPGFYDYCQAFFDRIGFRPTIIPEPADHHITLGLIAEGNGIALISASLRQVKRHGVVFRELGKVGKTLSMGIAVAYSETNHSPVLPAFLGIVRPDER